MKAIFTMLVLIILALTFSVNASDRTESAKTVHMLHGQQLRLEAQLASMSAEHKTALTVMEEKVRTGSKKSDDMDALKKSQSAEESELLARIGMKAEQAEALERSEDNRVKLEKMRDQNVAVIANGHLSKSEAEAAEALQLAIQQNNISQASHEQDVKDTQSVLEKDRARSPIGWPEEKKK